MPRKPDFGEDQVRRADTAGARMRSELGLVVVITAILFVTVGGLQRIHFAAQSMIYGNVPALHGCADSPLKSSVEAELATENPFLIRDDIYAAGAWSLDACPEHAHLRVDFAGTAARQQLEAYLAQAGAWDPTSGWTWRGIPVSLINV
jgi:hypothetical protein